MELQILRDQLNALENEKDRIAQQGLDTSFQDATIREVKAHIADLESQQERMQAHEGRMEEATQTIGYILDTLNVEGLTMAEIITNDDEYSLVRKGVQEAFISQAATYSQSINDLQVNQTTELNAAIGRAIEAEGQLEKEQSANKALEVVNYKLGLENDELSEKVRKGAEALGDANSQIEQQKKHIEDLQTQIAIGTRAALNVIELPQDTSKMAADIIARKVRITDVQFKDESGIDRRMKKAVEVLSGNEIEYEAIYERRYIILNLEEAAQYRAEIEQKKADEEAQNAVIPTIEPDVEPVSEVEAPAEETPFPESEVHSPESTMAEGSPSSDREVAAEESEVVTRAEFNTLRRDCKQNNNIQQYIENDMDKFKGWAAKVEQILIEMGKWSNEEPNDALTPYGLSLNNEAVA